LRYVLAQNGTSDPFAAVCVGEHGSRTIPVYQSEENYVDTMAKVRGLLKNITAKAGSPRNLATGVWLAKLAITLTQSEPCLHNVCSYVPAYNAWLTWPCHLTSLGVLSRPSVDLGAHARQALAFLLEQKSKELPDLLTISHAAA
jgi:hypothetical protein